jgi:restriction endonuclease S subunit
MGFYLRDIAQIKSGVFAKPGLEPVLYYLKGSDFDDAGELNEVVEPSLENRPDLAKHLLSNRDVLFAAKGRQFFAAVYTGRFAPAVASTTFFVIKVDEAKILPEFLAWYLNHPETNSFLSAASRGSSIPMVPKSMLEEMLIPVPDIQTQQKIVALSVLQKRRKGLALKIESLKTEYINNITYQIIQN